ncbi:MAG: ATP-binding cassette domain-containing protein, partial [Oscillospiraceae bacterium]
MLKILNRKKNDFLKQYENFSEKEKQLKKEHKNNLIKEENDLFLDIAKLIGGFVVVPDIKNVILDFLKKYDLCVENYNLNQQVKKLTIKKSCSKKENIIFLAKKIDELNYKIKINNQQLIICERNIEKERTLHKNNEIFLKCESYLDNGIDLAKLDYKEMRDLRRDLQIIFQDPYSSLNPRMTVGQIIGEGLLAHNFFKKNDCNMQEYVISQMEKCGLSAYMINRYPHQFSGGQRQRIGIARSLSLKPKFVVCDEAVSALDVSIQSQIINLLQDLKEKENLTYLFISHDLSVVKYISDRIGVMYLGTIVELASSDEIFKRPLHPYTKALLSAIPTTDVENKKQVVPLQGDIPSPVKPPKGCKFHTRCKFATD